MATTMFTFISYEQLFVFSILRTGSLMFQYLLSVVTLVVFTCIIEYALIFTYMCIKMCVIDELTSIDVKVNCK